MTFNTLIAGGGGINHFLTLFGYVDPWGKFPANPMVPKTPRSGRARIRAQAKAACTEHYGLDYGPWWL